MLAPVKRQPIFHQVIAHIKRYITEKRLSPNDKLPTEKILAEQLGVSRLTVREALKAMESMGILQLRPRDGCRLRALTMKPVIEHLHFLLDAQGLPFGELVEARRIVEQVILPLAANRADATDFQRMQDSIDCMRTMVEKGDLGTDPDVAFHQALAAASKNRALEGFGSMLQEFFQQARAVWGLRTREDRWRTIREHTQIVQALRDQDAEKAQRIMTKHLATYDEFVAEKG